MIASTRRTIITDKPRVTIFNINWNRHIDSNSRSKMIDERSNSQSVSSQGIYHLGVKAEFQGLEQEEGLEEI